MSSLSLAGGAAYQELDGWPWDDGLLELALGLIELQKQAAAPLLGSYEPDATGAAMVSADRLERLLESGHEVKGLATDREISNALPFNQSAVTGSIRSSRLARLRRRLDATVSARIGELFGEHEDPVLAPTGQYWYPSGGYMGWHTNSGFPGWRMYISHSEEPGKSFFRYREPRRGDVVTSPDGEWTVRVFRISRDDPLWHAIYSNTNRYSFGYMVKPWSRRDGAIRGARRALAAVEGSGARLLGGNRPTAMPTERR
jgi:hypothetical protein